MKLAALCCTLLALALPAVWGAPRSKRATCSIPYCSDCVNEELVCAACKAKQVMSSDKKSCLPCSPSTCVACKDVGEGVTHCTACQSGYRLNNLVSPPNCEKCALGCLKCDKAGAGKCDVKKCEDGYTFSNTTQTCLACASKCTQCDDRGQGKCDDKKCFDRWVLSTDSHTCKACASNCKSCANNGKGKCDECDVGYALSDTNTCQACHINCHECTSPGKCTSGKCHPTYVYNQDTQECDTCSDHCNSCSVKDQCNTDACKDGYGYKSSDQTCRACNSPTCKSCSANEEDVMVCTKCIDHYMKIGSPTCDSCPEHCRSCGIINGKTECDSSRCELGYVRYNGQCHKCPEKCNTGGENQEFCTYDASTSKTKCKTGFCEVGYQADVSGDGKCMACPDGCTQCSVRNGKTECDYDYCEAGRTYKSSDKTCSKCPQNCNTCFLDENGVVLCSQCQARYALNSERTSCHACKSNCKLCEYDDASRQTHCLDDQCETGYTSWEDPQLQRWSCTSCPSGCDKCTYHASNQSITCNNDGCRNTHAQNKISGINSCHECTNCQETFCKWVKYQQNPDQYRSECDVGKCNPGYVRNSIGLCKACPYGCEQCDVGQDDITTTCSADHCYAEGFAQVVSKTCVGCPIGCDTCSYNAGPNTLTCDTCKSGYTMHASRCYPCPPRCTQCTWDNNDARATCNSNQCEERYVVSNGLCVSCAQNCLQCDVAGPGGCNTCDIGFKLEVSGSSSSCSVCAAHCRSCTTQGAGKCDECKDKYKLAVDFTSCDVCASKDNCETCVVLGGGKCDRCNRGYTTNDDNTECRKCPGNCNYCEVVNEMVRCRGGGCAPGYVMDTNRQCQGCPTGCASCGMSGSNTVCDVGKCKQGYVQDTANNNECVACPSNCKTCHLDGGVAKCDPDGCFIESFQNSVTGLCQRCASHCHKCSVVNKCDTDGCVDNYVYQSSTQTCVPCHINCLPGQCTSANAGNGKCDLGRCALGYGIDSTYVCQSCDPNCDHCNNIVNNDFGANKCDPDGCQSTYTYHSGSQTCVTCDVNCAGGCSTQGQSKCDASCASGYGLNSAYQCIRCDTGCSSGCSTRAAADLEHQCDSACEGGYYFNSTLYECVPCTSTGCTACAGGPDTCTACTTVCTGGMTANCWDLDSDACNACDVHCVGTCRWMSTPSTGAECQAVGSGRTCELGWRSDGSDLVVCEECNITGCITCDADVNICEACDTTCNTPGSTSCYALQDSSTCTACHDQCSGTCSWNAVNNHADCSACANGYGLDANLDCALCDSNCAICSVNGYNKCDPGHCNPGWVYHTTTMTCVQCDSYCTTQSSCGNAGQGKCDGTCDQGYRYDAGTQMCQQCGTSCWTCDQNGAGFCDGNGCATTFGLDSGTNQCSACSANCDTCDINGPARCDSSGCQAGYAYDSSDMLCKKYFCTNGEYLQSNLITCSAVPLGCLAADMAQIDGTGTATICPSWACEQGFTWDSTSSTCRQCPSECESCYWESGAAVCHFSGCRNLHALNNDVCPACPKGCDHCQGTGLTGSSDPKTECKTNQCNSRYAEVTGTNTCVKCDTGCDSCAFNPVKEDNFNVIECSAALTTYTLLEDSQCYPCPHDCDNCLYEEDAGRSTCNSKQCTVRFTQNPDTMECVACPDNCKKCRYTGGSPQPTECETDQCDDGYTQDETTKDCIQCPTDCKICKKNGTVQCLPGGCYPKKYQDPVALSCTGCPGNCEKCEQIGNTYHCLRQQCDVEYGLKRPEMTCNGCGTGCDKCHNEGNNAQTCTQCQTYYELEAGSCYACPEACKQCTYNGGNTKCNVLQCDPLYTQDTSAERRDCKPCPSYCSKCSWNSEQARAECDAGYCNAGYTNKDDGTCGECSTNCVSCATNGAGKCDICDPGYAPTDDQTCAACSPNCYECTKKNECNSGQCHPRYTFDSETSTCKACDPHCSKCTSNGQDKCDTGTGDCDTYYTYNDEDQTCTLCPAHCKRCSVGADENGISRLECHADQCDPYWGVDQKFECSECPDNCASCKVINGVFQCDVCNASYVKNSGDCGACPNLCDSCSEVTGKGLVCDKCQEDAAIRPDKTCVACPSECATCTWTNERIECTSCKKSTHAIDNNKMCTVCSTVTGVANCASCTNADSSGASTCTSCNGGYTLKEDKSECLSCSSNGLSGCNGCIDEPPTCKTCKDGFTATPDRYQCGVDCNKCIPSNGKNCKETKNDVKEICPIGQGNNMACWSVLDEENEVQVYTRGCRNETCGNSFFEESCKYNTNKKECKKCCDGVNRECSSSMQASLTGHTHSTASAISALQPVLLAIALAAVLVGYN